MSVDVTVRTLATEYPMYTKAGNVWPKRINWSEIEVKNNIIKTHFGTFTFIKAEKVNKIWYWILKDNNNTFRVKREQARKNKRTPKNIEVISTFTFKYLPYQLCLPVPKELIDVLVEEANTFAEEKNKKAKNFLETTTTYKDFVNTVSDIYEVFEIKVHYVYAISKQMRNTKQVYKMLANAYHPDKTKQNTHDAFTCIKSIFKEENLINK